MIVLPLLASLSLASCKQQAPRLAASPPTPTPHEQASAPPQLILDAEFEAVGEEATAELKLAPGARQAVMAEVLSQVPPSLSCAEGALYFSWQVVSPPRGEVSFSGIRMDAVYPLGRGNSGRASAGICTSVEVANEGGNEVVLRLRWQAAKFKASQ